jgi:hypothetical protein
MEGFDEELPAYVGHIEASATFNIVPFVEAATLSVKVEYQACTDRLCYPPDAVSLQVRLHGTDLIRD